MRSYRTPTVLLVAFCAAFYACTSPVVPVDPQPPKPGLDTTPEGPDFEAVQATTDGATVATAAMPGAFAVSFPAASERPSATFSFKKTDINDRVGLALDVINRGTEPVRIYADLDGDKWVRGYVLVEPGKAGTLYVFARRKKHSAEVLEKFPSMHGVPGGRMSLWAGLEEPIVAETLKVFVVKPATEAKIEVRHLRPFGSAKIPDSATLFPFVDRYGQYKHTDWPGKVHADPELMANRTREDADLAAHTGATGLDKFGGWAAGPQLKASGHFRVEKYEGKWWLVDPEGRLFWSHGLDMVGFMQSTTRTQGREKFYDDPAPNGNFLTRNLETKYGAQWRDLAGDRLLVRLKSWGLNTLGGGGDRTLTAKQQVPYTVLLNSGGRGSGIDPNSAAWADGLKRALTQAAERIKDDPWCIGFFVDNEIHVSGDPAWWESYYRQVGATAKEIMPNKLYLGSRLDYHDWPEGPVERREIVRSAAKYCDIVSFNFYKFTLDDVALPEGVDRPAIIGEFHFGALDRGMFHTGLRSVVDQNHRAEAYRLYVESAARNPAIVGAHWFQCYDESLTGRFDGENYQIGFLDICDTPYPETIAAARDVGYRLYGLRSGRK